MVNKLGVYIKMKLKDIMPIGWWLSVIFTVGWIFGFVMGLIN